jgi:hypothetical protein
MPRIAHQTILDTYDALAERMLERGGRTLSRDEAQALARELKEGAIEDLSKGFVADLMFDLIDRMDAAGGARVTRADFEATRAFIAAELGRADRPRNGLSREELASLPETLRPLAQGLVMIGRIDDVPRRPGPMALRPFREGVAHVVALIKNHDGGNRRVSEREIDQLAASLKADGRFAEALAVKNLFTIAKKQEGEEKVVGYDDLDGAANRLTGGAAHVTDPSNASRTLLFDLAAGTWSDELCGLFDVPRSALPEVVPSSGVVGTTDPDAFLGLSLPVAGIAGDQQAALFGQACYSPGDTKCTYGTGSFVLTNTGTQPVRSDAGLLTTAAWDIGQGLVYALEGSIFVTGAAVQWLRDGLGLIDSAAEIEGLASTVADSGEVVFVPALTGLGAPHWDPHARGALLGITRGTHRAHIARATLESIAFQVRDVVDVMVDEAGLSVPELSADGGASSNDLLMQLQADELGVPVRRPVVAETTALGAAFLAGLGTRVWDSTDELARTWALDRRFEPEPGRRDDGRYDRWREAVRRAGGWAS